MAYIVTTLDAGNRKVPLRGTIWAFSMDRAQHFETRELARTALDRARRFMKASAYRSARIEEV